METLIDEIAQATKQDPVACRLKLMQGGNAKRYRAALELVVEKSGNGRNKPAAGTAFGEAGHESFEPVVANVVESRMAGRGKGREAQARARHRRRAQQFLRQTRAPCKPTCRVRR